MNQDKIISLKVHKKDFEEIYFKGNQGSLFFSPTTKNKTITTLVVICLVAITFALKDQLSEKNFGILYFLSFIFLLCAVYLSLGINKVSRWKKEVVAYLKTLEKAEIYQIKLNDKIFTVNLNHQKETCLWTEFTSYEMDDDFISLEGKYNYMFPRKSMSTTDYDFLKQAVKKNVKQ